MKKYIFLTLVLLILGLGHYLFQLYFKEETKIYNIKTDFGAKGDGITDDTESIQEAIKKVPNGSTLKIPRGVYNIKGDNAFKL